MDQSEQGESSEATAEVLGVNRRTVYRWRERAHHGGRDALLNRVKRTLDALEGRVELFFLPGYSPELNPDEQVWGYVKSQIGRGAIKTKEELEARARSLLHSLQKPPQTVAGFFRHPECQYAA